MIRTVLRCLAGLAGALAMGQGVAAACSVTERARVPVEFVNGTIFLEVKVNGRSAQMILDTGAQRSLVTPAALARLDLEQDDLAATSTRGIGGIERNRNALPRSLSLGGVPLARRTVNHDTSLTVGALGQAVGNGRRVDGMLGRDLLSLFDLDLDLRGGSVGLFTVMECSKVVPRWPGPYSALPVQNPADTALQVTVEVDGIRLRALLDTGAGATMVTAPGMARLGVEEALLEQDPVVQLSGLGERSVAARRHRFRSLRIGDITIDQPRLLVAPVRVFPVADMILGSDFLADRKVWISFTTSQVFVAPR